MTTSLTLDDHGRPVLEIADQQGEVWTYTLAPAEPKGARWACLVEREPARRGGHTWRVAEVRPGLWWCACPDFTYRGWVKRNLNRGPGEEREFFCKHVAAVRPLAAVLALFLARPPAPVGVAP